MKNYKQCKLRHGDEYIVGWIETRGAFVGKSVELKSDNRYYDVVEVYDFAIDEQQLAEKQARDRNCLSSINN